MLADTMAYIPAGESGGVCEDVQDRASGGHGEVRGATRDVHVPL